jgi:hypothetical protein
MIETSRIAKNYFQALPSDAPLTSPAMSTNSTVAGFNEEIVIFSSNFVISAIYLIDHPVPLLRLFGSIVANG